MFMGCSIVVLMPGIWGETRNWPTPVPASVEAAHLFTPDKENDELDARLRVRGAGADGSLRVVAAEAACGDFAQRAPATPIRALAARRRTSLGFAVGRA